MPALSRICTAALVLGTTLISAPALANGPRFDAQGVDLFPYGTSTPPTVRCSPDQACELVFEPDEIVFDLVAGDTVRWIIGKGFSGPKANIPLVFFKPNDVGTSSAPIRTNLIVTTNRRTYEVNMLAVAKTEHTRYGFYYPQEQFAVTPTVNAPSGSEAAPQPTEQANRQATSAPAPVGPPPRPDTYNIVGNTEYRPIAVWNDVIHTYIQMPPLAIAPSIYTETSGTIGMINYHPPINDVYTLDGRPDHIVLIGGIGKKVPHIDIFRK